MISIFLFFRKTAPLPFLRLLLVPLLAIFLSGCPSAPPAPENFSAAKAILEDYVWHDHRQTIYCGAAYDADKNISLPPGFTAHSHERRAARMEWEHAVPAENFGRAFSAWREGDPSCVKNGKPYKGRRCAEKSSPVFRKMEADMYNLFPSIGAVNAARGTRQYAELPEMESAFGSCKAKIHGGEFEPPNLAKGQVARAALYMDRQYREYNLSNKQKRLFQAWNRQFPPDKWECERGRRIYKIQGNKNPVLDEACANAGY